MRVTPGGAIAWEIKPPGKKERAVSVALEKFEKIHSLTDAQYGGKDGDGYSAGQSPAKPESERAISMAKSERSLGAGTCVSDLTAEPRSAQATPFAEEAEEKKKSRPVFKKKPRKRWADIRTDDSTTEDEYAPPKVKFLEQHKKELDQIKAQHEAEIAQQNGEPVPASESGTQTAWNVSKLDLPDESMKDAIMRKMESAQLPENPQLPLNLLPSPMGSDGPVSAIAKASASTLNDTLKSSPGKMLPSPLQSRGDLDIGAQSDAASKAGFASKGPSRGSNLEELVQDVLETRMKFKSKLGLGADKTK